MTTTDSPGLHVSGLGEGQHGILQLVSFPVNPGQEHQEFGVVHQHWQLIGCDKKEIKSLWFKEENIITGGGRWLRVRDTEPKGQPSVWKGTPPPTPHPPKKNEKGVVTNTNNFLHIITIITSSSTIIITIIHHHSSPPTSSSSSSSSSLSSSLFKFFSPEYLNQLLNLGLFDFAFMTQ